MKIPMSGTEQARAAGQAGQKLATCKTGFAEKSLEGPDAQLQHEQEHAFLIKQMLVCISKSIASRLWQMILAFSLRL